jgi:hypothetical protein
VICFSARKNKKFPSHGAGGEGKNTKKGDRRMMAAFVHYYGLTIVVGLLFVDCPAGWDAVDTINRPGCAAGLVESASGGNIIHPVGCAAESDDFARRNDEANQA